MALSYLLSPTFQFTNVSGKPLTDGYVNVYISGTRSKYYAFSDFDGTLHPFNIPLNSLGSAVILVSPAHSYDIYVYNSVGTLQMSRYNITPATGEGTVITDVTTISSKDGTVDITANSSTDYDLSIATKIAELKEYTDQAKNDVIESVNTSIANLDDKKKDKQDELNFNGSATKTVKKITQYPNGELNVEFEDIDLPGYSISSSDGSINVSTSEGVTDLTLPSDVVRDSAYTHIDAATANPLMNSNAAVGISTKYAREDHVHPSDTSKEDIANKTTVILGMSDSKYPTDKAVAEFVNSSIATNTANYISNNGEPFTSVEQLEAYSGPVTNNDYAFVTGTDSDGNTYYDRYKATVKGSSVTWALEYRLNNSSFTAAQWSAINSGITSALVAKIHTHSNKDVLDGITSSDIANWNSKQNSLTAGDNITIDGNTISSDQVFVATYGTTKYAEVKAAYNAGKICTVLYDSRYYYVNLVDNRHIVFIALDDHNTLYSVSVGSGNTWSTYTGSLQSKLTFDTAPTAGSSNPVTSDGIKKEVDKKLNVDASNATTFGVTAMMKKVETGSAGLDDNSTYFGDRNSDHSYIVRRPITDIWYYINKKVKQYTLGSAGSADKPIYLENGVPKVCSDGIPYSEVSYGESVGYGVFVGGEHNLAKSSRCYCTFLVSVVSYPDNIAHTYIGTFSFRGGILNSELKCLTGTPAYPLRIVVASNVAGKDSNGNPTYTVGLYVIPVDKTYKYSSYKLTRIASDSDFIWDVRTLSEAEYDSCNPIAKPTLRPIILTWDAKGSNVSTTGGTWIPTFDKATIIDARGIVDMSIQVDMSIIGQTTYVGDLASYDITLVNSSKTDILPESLHQSGRMPRATKSSTGGGTVDISCTHRFIFPITSTTNLLAGYMPKITLPSNYPLDSRAQVSIRALCRGIILPYGADEYF